MIVAAIDTSHREGAVALARDGAVLGAARFGADSSHLVEIGRSLDGLLDAAGLSIGDVDRLAVVDGPGSFTGLRVGMAFVKGLHAGLGADLVKMGSLELMALPHLGRHDVVCAMIDAFRSEVYAAVYRRGDDASARAVVAPRAAAPERFLAGLAEAPALFTGTGAARYIDAVRAAFPGAETATPLDAPPSIEYLARIAHGLPPLPRGAVRSLEPAYIRSSGAKLKRLKPVDPR